VDFSSAILWTFPIAILRTFYSALDNEVDGDLPTDYRFTGQQQDASGLVYMNVRYYDPVLGQLISPDTLVPDPSNVQAYNRYLYALGNPLKYKDPTGHWPDWTGIPNPYEFIAWLIGMPDSRQVANATGAQDLASLNADTGQMIAEVVDNTNQVLVPVVETGLSLVNPAYDLQNAFLN
jgi:RHS repeat-associated protein